MQTNDENNQPLDTGHCMSSTVSGAFIMLARSGKLVTVCEMIQERATITKQIQQVEQELQSFKHPYALAPLGLWSETRNQDFEAELRQRAEKLEMQKCELTEALQEIDEQLTLQNLGFDWTVMPTFVSLIPTSAKRLEPVVALRQMIIDQNLGKSHFEICILLDFPWRDGEAPAGFLPERWQEKYGVKTFVAAYRHADCRKLVEPMISKRKPRSP